jgi:RNA polymerase sigma-70 factor (ECF subfamily)
MNEHELAAPRRAANVAHLRTMAQWVLGSQSEADDAFQEAWVRLGRSRTSGLENVGEQLTSLLADVCLDRLRARESRRERTAMTG